MVNPADLVSSVKSPIVISKQNMFINIIPHIFRTQATTRSSDIFQMYLSYLIKGDIPDTIWIHFFISYMNRTSVCVCVCFTFISPTQHPTVNVSRFLCSQPSMKETSLCTVLFVHSKPCMEWLHNGNRILCWFIWQWMRHSVVMKLFIHQMAMMHLCLGRRGLDYMLQWCRGTFCFHRTQHH